MLGSDGRLKGMSPANPLPKDSAFNKSLKQKPKPLPAAVPVFKPWKPAEPARFKPFKPAQPAKIVMQKAEGVVFSTKAYPFSFQRTPLVNLPIYRESIRLR
ncbi:hypothetical protein [Blastopirellula retiformator]|uniref:hypothetical protein n=1 Tax=Blastopirellula retiformator TaxID=2527970 RepID=UPI0011B5477A|nr:hypothetical protein [Blastopirellula retiformator]